MYVHIDIDGYILLLEWFWVPLNGGLFRIVFSYDVIFILGRRMLTLVRRGRSADEGTLGSVLFLNSGLLLGLVIDLLMVLRLRPRHLVVSLLLSEPPLESQEFPWMSWAIMIEIFRRDLASVVLGLLTQHAP